MVATQTAWSMQPWCPLRKSDAARTAASCQDSIRPRTKTRGLGRGASESHRSARRTRASSANSSGHSSSGIQRGYSVAATREESGALRGRGSGIPVPSCSNRSRRRQLPVMSSHTGNRSASSPATQFTAAQTYFSRKVATALREPCEAPGPWTLDDGLVDALWKFVPLIATKTNSQTTPTNAPWQRSARCALHQARCW